MIDYLPSGTEVQYFLICHTKLWLFSHYIRMEDNSDDVIIGRVLHEDSYKREQKNIIIQGNIALDFIKSDNMLIIHEIKKEYKFVEVHRMQLLYYLWYARNILGLWPLKGIIDYPTHKKREDVYLDDNDDKRILDINFKISQIIHQEKIPNPQKNPACSKCAYYEFCWV